MPGTPTVSHAGRGKYVLKDGNHRVNAALRQGKRMIDVRVQKLASNLPLIQFMHCTAEAVPRKIVKRKIIKKPIQFGAVSLIRKYPKTAIAAGTAAGIGIGAAGAKASGEMHRHAWNDHQPDRGARSPEEIAAHYKKLYPTAYLSGSSALKIGVPGSSDVDVHIPTRSVKAFKKVESRLLKTLEPSAYYKPGYDHAGFTGKMDGRPIDVAVTYGEKGFQKRDAIRRVASTLTDDDRRKIIATKQRLKKAWIAPEARYHAYKRGLDIKHGIPLWRAEKLPEQQMSAKGRPIQFGWLGNTKSLIKGLRADGVKIIHGPEVKASQYIAGQKQIKIAKGGTPGADSPLAELHHEAGHHATVDSILADTFRLSPQNSLQRFRENRRTPEILKKITKIDASGAMRADDTYFLRRSRFRLGLEQKANAAARSRMTPDMLPHYDAIQKKAFRTYQTKQTKDLSKAFPRHFASREKLIQLDDDLQPHQQRVIRRLRDPNTSGLVVAHGLGSGKTRTSIEAHKALGGTADIILPAALKGNYAKEIEKWGADPSKMNIQSQQAIATRGEPLTGNLLVVDEGHRARNPGTKISKAIKESTAKKRMILTGTPIYNNPSDIATLVNQAAGKDVLREGKAFQNRYTNPGVFAKWRGKRISNEGELKKHLQKYVDYHPGDPSVLPKVTSKTVGVPMGRRQSELYRASMGKIPKGVKLDRENLERLKPYLTGPRQVSNTARALDKGSNEEPKIDRAFTDLQDHLKNPKGKALIYSNWLEHGVRPIQKRLEQAGVSHGVFTGQENMKTRNQTVKDYNEGKHRALIISSSGAEGLDLKGTRMVQVLEPHFNNAKIRQVVGRSARMGSHSHLPEDERNVEVRQYVGRPRNRFFPGHSKGVEDLLNDTARDKDEVARQIMGLLSSKIKPIQFATIPDPDRRKVSTKRVQGALIGTQWESPILAQHVKAATDWEMPYMPARGKAKKGEAVPSTLKRVPLTEINPADLGTVNIRESGKKQASGLFKLRPPVKGHPDAGSIAKPSDWRAIDSMRAAEALRKEAGMHGTEAQKSALANPEKRHAELLKSEASRTTYDPVKDLDRKQGLQEVGGWRRTIAKDVRENRRIIRSAQRIADPKAARPMSGEEMKSVLGTKSQGKLYSPPAGPNRSQWSKGSLLGTPKETRETLAYGRYNLEKMTDPAMKQYRRRQGEARKNLFAKVRKHVETNVAAGGKPIPQEEITRKAGALMEAVKPRFPGKPVDSTHYEHLVRATGYKPEKIQKLHDFLDPVGAGAAPVREVVRGRLIKTGRIWNDNPLLQKKQYIPTNVKPKYMKGAGIAAGVVGAGLLVRRMFKKRDEQKMSRKGKIIQLAEVPLYPGLIRALKRRPMVLIDQIEKAMKPGVTTGNMWAKAQDPFQAGRINNLIASKAPVSAPSRISVAMTGRESRGAANQLKAAEIWANNPTNKEQRGVIKNLKKEVSEKTRQANLAQGKATVHGVQAKIYKDKSKRAGKSIKKVVAIERESAAQKVSEAQARSAQEIASANAAFQESLVSQSARLRAGKDAALGKQAAAHTQDMNSAKSNYRKKLVITGAAASGAGALGGYIARRPEEEMQFSMDPRVKKAALKGYAKGWAFTAPLLIPGTGQAGGAIGATISGMREYLKVPGIMKRLNKNGMRTIYEDGLTSKQREILGRLDIKGRKTISMSAKGGLITFLSKEQRDNLEGAGRMGASAGLSGAVGGLAIGTLSRPRTAPSWSTSKPAPFLKKLGRASKLGAKAGLGLGAAGMGASLLGSAFLGAPKDKDSTAFTKRGAIGGAITGAAGGAVLAGLSLRPGKAHRLLSRYAKSWLPVESMLKSGPAARMAIGAGLGTVVGAAHLADEGQQVDTMRNLKKPVRMSSRIKPIYFKEEDEKMSASSKLKRGAVGLIGGSAVIGNIKPLLGLKTVYHGTKKANAEGIKASGLHPRFGGGETGASFNPGDHGQDIGSAEDLAAQRKQFTEHSRGKIFVTPSSRLAKTFSGDRGEVIKATISQKDWERMRGDGLGAFGDDALDHAAKDSSAYSKRRIPIEQIHGSKASLRARAIRTLKDMRRGIGRGDSKQALASVLIGGALIAGAAKWPKKKEQQMSSRIHTIQLTSGEMPLTGKLAADRYKKKINDEDLDRRDANILRSGVAGAGLGGLLRGKSGALIGAGAGAASVLGIRQLTNRNKDIYGDRTRGGKSSEALPWKLAGLGAAGLLGYRGYRRLGFGSRQKLIQFAGWPGDDDSAPYYGGTVPPGYELVSRKKKPSKKADRHWSDKWIGPNTNVMRRGEDVRVGYKRGSALLGDVKGVLKGEKALDARGRPRKREWEKTYANKIIAGAIVGGGLLAARKVKGWHVKEMIDPGSPLAKTLGALKSGEALAGLRKKSKLVDKIASKFGHVKEAVAGENASLLNRGAARLNKWLGIDKAKDAVKAAEDVVIKGKGGRDTVLRANSDEWASWQRAHAAPEINAAESVAERAAKETEGLKKNQGQNYSSAQKLIQFFVDERDQYGHAGKWRLAHPTGGSVRVVATDREPHFRRKKYAWETDRFDNYVIKPAIFSAGAIAGGLAMRHGTKAPAAAANIANIATSASQGGNIAERIRRAMQAVKAMSSQDPLITLNARLTAILH
jgi:hypothetical protein